MTPDPTPVAVDRAVDFGDPEWNDLWDEAVASRIEPSTARVLIRTVMPEMEKRLRSLRAERLAMARAVVALTAWTEKHETGCGCQEEDYQDHADAIADARTLVSGDG